ncbi:RHS repeat domain-containing protein [Erythrobacter sp. HI0063]|uniref:RHS repeat domain-containing protein n=1 Tax=Erythrobacter sp. HI0063 TaxID=1822240 RepID=UPI0035150808
MVLALSALSCASAGQASETTTYTYDAKGRLVKVQRSGGTNNGTTRPIIASGSAPPAADFLKTGRKPMFGRLAGEVGPRLRSSSFGEDFP